MTRRMKEFHNVTTELNFCNVSASPSYINRTTELNYDIDSYDSSFPVFQILLDFMESYAGPDILS